MIGIKEFNKKIGSLKNTRKMTKTMKMVSASKFKRAHKAQMNAQVYADKLTGLISRLSQSNQAQHPLMRNKKNSHKILVLLFTSDKGLCGGFNNNLIRSLRRWITEKNITTDKIDMSCCGRRGHMAFRRSVNIKKVYEGITLKPAFSDAALVANDIAQAFLNSEYDEVYVASNEFRGPLSQVPVIKQVLPLNTDTIKTGAMVKAVDYVYEPQQAELFKFLLPKYLNFKIFFTLLENAAGEHGARMAAMDKATQNTADLIDHYTLLRNRARQASITTELIEIISGAEALK